MAFRGISLEPIHRSIQARLEELRLQHSYDTDPAITGLKVNPLTGKPIKGMEHKMELDQRTVWYSLRSNAQYWNENGGSDGKTPEWTQPLYSKLGPKWDKAEDELFGLLASIGGAQESWTNRSARPHRNNTPPPGVESISISTKGTLGSIKTADIKLKVWHPDDIEHIERAYLMPGITLFLEWGWSGTSPIPELVYESLKDTKSTLLDTLITCKTLGLPPNLEGKLEEANAKTASDKPEELLKRNPGQYDAMLGVITKFNWSLAGDGSYDISITIISPNSLMMGCHFETHKMGAQKITGYKLKTLYVKGTKEKVYVAQEKVYAKVSRKVSRVQGMTDAEFLLRYVNRVLNNKSLNISKAWFELSEDNTRAIEAMDAEIAKTEKLIKSYEKTAKKYRKMSTGFGAIGRTEEDKAEYKEVADNYDAGVDSQKEHKEGLEEALADLKAEAAEVESDVEMSEGYKLVNGYTMPGEGKIRYFATDPDGIIKEVLSNVTIVSSKQNYFNSKKSKIKFTYLYSTKQIADRGGNVAGFSEGYSRKGSLLACTGLVTKQGSTPSIEMQYYISWRFIEDYLLQNCTPRDGNNRPILAINSTSVGSTMKNIGSRHSFPNQALNHPLIMSMDPLVCWLTGKQNDDAVTLMKTYLPNDAATIPKSPDKMDCVCTGEVGNNAFPGMKDFGEEKGILTIGNYSTLPIRDILFNINHTLSSIKSNRTIEKFVTSMLADANDCCGKPWEFSLKADANDSHILGVIESNCFEWKSNAKDALDQHPSIAERAAVDTEPLIEIPDDELNTVGGTDAYLEKVDAAEAERARGQLAINQTHYYMKGKGSGNFLQSISMNSKLPKSIQAMAFMSNKSAANNNPDKAMQDFNIYGNKIIDGFYNNPMTKPQSPAEAVKAYHEAKKTLFTDWCHSYNSLFGIDDTRSASSLNIRQQQSSIVKAVVFGTAETTLKPVPAPRLLPIELSVTLDGVSGIYQGNSLQLATIDQGGVMPNRYGGHVIWQITKVGHSISDAGWVTNLKCLMRSLPPGKI